MLARQTLLFPETKPDLDKPVNIASVPLRSPFRYPGGKTWLVPRIRQWLNNIEKPKILIEPFVGGGIVSLTVAFENLANEVIMVELDDEIAAVWQTVLSNDYSWLVEQILSFDMTIENVKDQVNSKPSSTKEKAFITILKNRTFHGGILAPGSGLIKNGENGKGIKSRWYPRTLANRINSIFEHREKISFIQDDAFNIIKQYRNNDDIVFFVDPPYTGSEKKAGRRLYRHHQLDHENLFKVCSECKGDSLITYDNDADIISLSRKYNLEFKAIAMKGTHNTELKELLISKDLSWAC
jgi:DNA adenine methylase